MAKKPDIEIQIAEAALRLAAAHDWRNLSLEQIAKAAKLPLTQIQKNYKEKDAILAAIIQYIDREVADSIGAADKRSTPHDRIFEVMMARFDILQEHREAIISIMDSAMRDPSLSRYLLPAQIDAMRNMLKLANLASEGPKEIVATTGLLAIYAAALCCWRRDETQDMSRTMAMLDRALRRTGKLAEIIFRAF